MVQHGLPQALKPFLGEREAGQAQWGDRSQTDTLSSLEPDLLCQRAL